MAMRRPKRQTEQDPFTDLLFNSLLAFTFLFLIAIIFMNPPARTGIIDPKAEYIITTQWEDNNPDDVDTWVESPKGQKVYFLNMEAGLMHLDRDDRGLSNDMLMVDGRELVNPLNQEVVTIRGTSPGEYVVNVHYYRSLTKEPVTVDVRVVKVNPKLSVVYYGSVTLDRQGDEATAVRFTISKDGRVKGINTLQKRLVSVDKI